MADLSQQLIRRLKDVYNNPRGALEQFVDQVNNMNKGRVAEINDRGAGYRQLSRDERTKQMTDAVLEGLGSGGMGALGVIKQRGGNWLTGSIEDKLKGLKRGNVTSPAQLEAIRRRGGEEAVARFIENGDKWDQQSGASAINNWIDKQLTKYIRNEMATPEDPVRLMAEAFPTKKQAALAQLSEQIARAKQKRDAAQAARGFTPEMMTRANAEIRDLEKRMAFEEARKGLHFDPADVNPNIADAADRMRKVADGFVRTPGLDTPGTVMSKSPTARVWEDVSDNSVGTQPVGVRKNYELQVEGSPWMLKLPDDTLVHHYNSSDSIGFDHLIDEMQNALNPESGLPKEFLLDQANLGKLTVPQMVEHVDKINAHRAIQKAEADAIRANNPAVRTFKEYTENNPKGMRWVEFKAPEEVEGSLPEIVQTARGRWAAVGKDGLPSGIDYRTREEAEKALTGGRAKKILEDALKYEGDTMQHCVGGYCENVMGGRSRIFSLRDAEGRPYATIETAPNLRGLREYVSKFEHPEKPGRLIPDRLGITDTLHDYIQANRRGNGDYDDFAIETLKRLGHPLPPETIVQIKGKNNRAPDPEALSYVQDFVKSGKWDEVRDMQNAGLWKHPKTGQFHTIEEGSTPELSEFYEGRNLGPEYWDRFAEGGLVRNNYEPIEADGVRGYILR